MKDYNFIEVVDINGKPYTLNKKYVIKITKDDKGFGSIIYIDTTVKPYQIPPYIPIIEHYDIAKLWFLES